MLNLPKSTEVNKILPKKAIYTKFQMDTSRREKIDKDISKISIVNEITPNKINIDAGKTIKSFYFIHIILKRKDYDEKSIIILSKLIPQNIVFILEYNGECRLAIFKTTLIQTNWGKIKQYKIELIGLNLDKVWENIIIKISGISIDNGKTLDEQLRIEETNNKINNEIKRLEKLARSEKQPKKKFELVQKINKIKKEIIS